MTLTTDTYEVLDVLDTLSDESCIAELAMRLGITDRSVERRLKPLRELGHVVTYDGRVRVTRSGVRARQRMFDPRPVPPPPVQVHPSILRATMCVVALHLEGTPT